MGVGGKGRPTKPTNLKMLHGDHKKHPERINKQEARPNSKDVLPPDDLCEEALEVWNRLADDLVAAGVLKYWDVEAYADYCEAVIDMRECRAHLREQGLVLEIPIFGRTGEDEGEIIAYKTQKNAWGTALMDAHRRFLAGCARFGLTPADRANIKVDKEPAGNDDRDLLTG